jgi:AAA domain
MTRLTWVEVCGLRSFGIEQSLIFDKKIALVWGGNSQGKTSVAEAIEFLLSGTVVRPAMLGGAKNEYDRSLRNAYHPDGELTVVRAGIEDHEGKERRVERQLTADFGRGQECASRLTVDGVEVEDLSSIGIVLAEPPLRAPVLFQHSIRYALSAAPSDRLTYFKALFEIGDLDAFADALKGEIDGLDAPPIGLETEIRACSADALIGPVIGDLLGDEPLTESALSDRLANACRAGIVALSGDPPGLDVSLHHLRDQLRAEVEKVQRGRFDLGAWRPGATVTAPEAGFEACREYLDAAARIDRDVEQLRVVYEAVLKVPAHEHLEHGVRCPVCNDGTLTPERMNVLREEVAAGTDLRGRQNAARRELQALTTQLRSVSDAARRVTPRASGLQDEELAEAAASAAAIVGEAVAFSGGRDSARKLAASSGGLADTASQAQSASAIASEQLDALAVFDLEAIESALKSVGIACEANDAARDLYLAEVGPTLSRVADALNQQVGTSGWDALVRLAEAPARTVAELRHRQAVASAKREFSAAHAAIERAKLAVFREKFAGMSDEILTWWNRLRPDEPVVFQRAEPRAGGRRFVDLKAKLSAGGMVEERDALGIFSDSQLNALGLAAFLARAILQGVPFVVLDDPVQAGDDEHRDTFIDVVLPGLVDAGLQVIVTTHDSHMRTLLSNVHQIDGFTVTLDEPEKGTVVIKGTDTAEALLDEVKGFIKETPSLRDTGAQKLRVAAERLAKEILVQKRQEAAERSSLGEYKKWSLEKLVPKLCEVLDDDKEKGNWRNVSLRLSPGAHDDAPPAKNTLKTVRDQLITSHKRHIKDAGTGTA